MLTFQGSAGSSVQHAPYSECLKQEAVYAAVHLEPMLVVFAGYCPGLTTYLPLIWPWE